MSELRGTGVALATPLKKDYSVDFTSLDRLVTHTIEGGVDYLVVMGTTGESPVFSWKEKLAILDFILEKNNGKKPVMFGLGGNHTFDLVDKSRELAQYDIDAILSVSPYYNRPSQKGLVRHFNMLADASPHPILLYNVPPRTGSNVSAKTTLTLAAHENIIGMKEASGDLSQINDILLNRPKDFLVVSGDDQLTLELIENGADGVISVVSNILPLQFSEMVQNCLNGNMTIAREQNQLLQEAYQLLSKEGNPSSLKAGLSVMEICNDTVKPPLFEGSSELKLKWEAFLSSLKMTTA
ncbi:MAG: 4-hydroxy-tetrahydrodipicolinate synthase [Bacteroidota bacterium]